MVVSTTYPIKNMDFPTVTLCPKNKNPDRWGMTVKMYDHMKISCSKDIFGITGKPCFVQGNAKDVFKNFFENVTNSMKEKISNKLKSYKEENLLEHEYDIIGMENQIRYILEFGDYNF